MSDDIWEMDDDAADAAFKAAKAEQESPETDLELAETSTEETSAEEEIDSSETTGELEDDGQDQPEDNLEESDHDSSDEDATEEVDEDNTTDTDDVNPDGDAEAEDGESSEETKDDVDEKQPAQSYAVKANGKDYEFTSEEIVSQFPKIFGKAMDYTKKMQAIKPWRKTIDAIEGAKISHDDIGLMIDVLKGDKDAITEVLKRTGTDTLELDTEAESGYKTKDYGRDESALAISDIVDEISKDTEYATTQNILQDDWDEKSWSTMTENPENIRLLHQDVKSGMYAKLQPIAEKLKVFGGGTKSDLEYYGEAAQQWHANDVKQKAAKSQKAANEQADEVAKQSKASEEKQARLTRAKAESTKRKSVKNASEKRKAAAPSKGASAEKVSDYLDDSDEGFDEWYKKLESSI